ncbi:hypothetical protein Pelo_17498 [Pelomyxa schiedti]|nr:hypothetical protein Pelo_17498 [Pelomyxa schiedti]
MGNNQGSTTRAAKQMGDNEGPTIREARYTSQAYTRLSPNSRCCLSFRPQLAPYSLLVELLLRACGVTSVFRHVVLPLPCAPPPSPSASASASPSPSPCPPSSPLKVSADSFDFHICVTTVNDDDDLGDLMSMRHHLFIFVAPGASVMELRFDTVLSSFMPAVSAVDAGAEMEAVTLKGFSEIAELLLPSPEGCPRQLSVPGDYFPMPCGRALQGVPPWFMAFCVHTLNKALLLARDGATADEPVYYYITPTRRKVSDRNLPLISEMLGARGAPIVRHSVNFEELGLGWLPALDNGELYLEDTTYKYEDVRDEFLDIIEAFFVTIAMAFKNNFTPKNSVAAKGTPLHHKHCCIVFQPHVAPYSLLVELLLRACGVESVFRHVVLPPPRAPSPSPSPSSPCPPSSPPTVPPPGSFDLFICVTTTGGTADEDPLPDELEKLGQGRTEAPLLLIIVTAPGAPAMEVQSSDGLIAAAVPAILAVDALSGAETGAAILKVFCEVAALLMPSQEGCPRQLGVLGGDFPMPSGRSSQGAPAWFMAFCVHTLNKALPLATAPVYYYITPTRRKVSDRDLPLISEMLGARGAPIVRHSLNFEELGLGWLPALDNGELCLGDRTYKCQEVWDEFLDIMEAFYVTIAMAFKNGKGTPPLSADSSLQTRSPTKIETPKPTNLPPKPPPNDHRSTANSQGNTSTKGTHQLCVCGLDLMGWTMTPSTSSDQQNSGEEHWPVTLFSSFAALEL